MKSPDLHIRITRLEHPPIDYRLAVESESYGIDDLRSVSYVDLQKKKFLVGMLMVRASLPMARPYVFENGAITSIIFDKGIADQTIYLYGKHHFYDIHLSSKDPLLAASWLRSISVGMDISDADAKSALVRWYDDAK